MPVGGDSVKSASSCGPLVEFLKISGRLLRNSRAEVRRIYITFAILFWLPIVASLNWSCGRGRCGNDKRFSSTGSDSGVAVYCKAEHDPTRAGFIEIGLGPWLILTVAVCEMSRVNEMGMRVIIQQSITGSYE